MFILKVKVGGEVIAREEISSLADVFPRIDYFKGVYEDCEVKLSLQLGTIVHGKGGGDSSDSGAEDQETLTQRAEYKEDMIYFLERDLERRRGGE